MLNPSCDLPDSGLAPDATPVDRARALLEITGFHLVERERPIGDNKGYDIWKRGREELWLWHDGSWCLGDINAPTTPLGLKILTLVIGDT